MDKVICDVCGTQYPENAEQCPICGCARTSGAATVADSVVTDEAAVRSTARVKGGRFSKENVQRRNHGEVLPEMQPAQRAKDVTRHKQAEEEPIEEQPAGQSKDVVINILLVIVILALLAVGGFIVKEFVLSGQKAEDPSVPSTDPIVTEAPTTAPTETTLPPVPCTDLSLPEDEANEIMLFAAGQSWLLNVTALPEDTTDEVVFTSMDEEVAYVNTEGRIIAVAEGATEIVITCGEQEIRFPVTCDFSISKDENATAGGSEGNGDGEEGTTPTAPLKDVTLKVDLTDISFGDKNLGYTFKVDGLKNNEVSWTSENENIVKVDQNGMALSVGRGTTNIIAQYGDQKVTIIVRCVF